MATRMQFCPLSATPIIFQQQFAVGAKIYVYDAGTTSPRVAYRDGTDNPEKWTNPISSDSNGCVPEIWVQGTDAYKVRITTASGAFIREIDNLPGEPASADGGAAATVEGYLTGDIICRYDTGTRTGFVRLNGRTIGSGSSGATERSNDDTQALYEQLWNSDPNLAVDGGRSSSAVTDFNAGRAIALPDWRGRVPVGRDTMGSDHANRLNGVAFDNSATSGQLGATGGEAVHALTANENGAHDHTGTTSTGLGTETISTGVDGAHAHTGTTDDPGPHTHSEAAPDAAPISGAAGGAIFASLKYDQTGPAGSHTHAVTIPSSGPHSHTFDYANPQHTHGFTTNESGVGQAHNNMPPFITVSWYIAL